MVYSFLSPIIFLPPHTLSIPHHKAKCCHRHITKPAESVQTGTYILKQTDIPERILYVRQLVGRWRLLLCRICGAATSSSSSFWLSCAASCRYATYSTLRSAVPSLERGPVICITSRSIRTPFRGSVTWKCFLLSSNFWSNLYTSGGG